MGKLLPLAIALSPAWIGSCASSALLIRHVPLEVAQANAGVSELCLSESWSHQAARRLEQANADVESCTQD